MRLELIALTPKLITRTLELAYAHDLTVYDATFMACAEELGAVVITADQKLVNKVKQPAKVRFLRGVGEERSGS